MVYRTMIHFHPYNMTSQLQKHNPKWHILVVMALKMIP